MYLTYYFRSFPSIYCINNFCTHLLCIFFSVRHLHFYDTTTQGSFQHGFAYLPLIPVVWHLACLKEQTWWMAVIAFAVGCSGNGDLTAVFWQQSAIFMSGDGWNSHAIFTVGFIEAAICFPSPVQCVNLSLFRCLDKSFHIAIYWLTFLLFFDSLSQTCDSLLFQMTVDWNTPTIPAQRL